MLNIVGLDKNFDGFDALSNVHLKLKENEKHAVIGPNGAGKTTFFNCITGHLKPTNGSVSFKQQEITGVPPYKIVRLGIARSFQRINIFPGLTVFENVQAALIADRGLVFNLFKSSHKLIAVETQTILDSVRLPEEADTIAGVMSYGKQKQLELAIALASEPALLLLDEPTAGMSPQETSDTVALIDQIASSRYLTLLFTEHDMEVVFSIADRISILHHGEIIATGTPDEVRSNEEVRRIYLGDTADAVA